MTVLKIDWCSYQASKYAVERWHYSKRMPAGKLVKVGAWEDDRYIGTVLFGRGANNNIGRSYNLGVTEVAELVRVALCEHQSPVSQIVAAAVRLLKKKSPSIRMLVSYADPEHDHVGVIYQAMNWIYVGFASNWKSGQHYLVWLHGEHNKPTPMHGRSVRLKWGTVKNVPYKIEENIKEPKHKYLLPLDKRMRREIEHYRQPYPKRAGD